MDGRRTIGGFVGTLGGFVMSVIQTTHPEWLGNHPSILPASFVLLFCSAVLWMCQYRWAQVLLGITDQNSPPKSQWKVKQYWQDKFSWADGERIKCEAELRTTGEVHNEEVRKLEATHKAELGSANEFIRQCEIDRQEALGRVRQLEAQLSLFTPLQVDTLTLSKELLQFLADMGSRPEVNAEMFLYDSRGNRKDSNIVIQEHMAETNRVLLPWMAKVRSTFKTDLLPKLEDISLRYGKLGIGVDLVPHNEEYLLDSHWFFDASLELVKLAHGIDTMKVVPHVR